MTLTDIGGLLLGLAGVVVVGALMAAAPATFEALFRSPVDLGWPAGVQEDDDMRWSWGSERSSGEQAAPESGSDPTYEVRPTRIRPRLTRR